MSPSLSMMSSAAREKPHAVCVPFPAQGHINATLNLAKILHSKGFHITFVNTEHKHRRIFMSRGTSSPQDLPDFRFETIPDGLPSPAYDNDIPSISASTQKTCSIPFRDLISKLNHPSSNTPPVSCIVSDGLTSFTLLASAEFGIPNVFFWSPSACSFMCVLHYKHLLDRGIVPLKDESDLSNGYLETLIEWIPGTMKGLRLKDLPTFMRITDPDDMMFNFVLKEMQRAPEATAIIFNTFDDLEGPVLEATSSMLQVPIYSIGPLNLHCHSMKPESPLTSMRLNIWEEDTRCIGWLDDREPRSVVYVNFGSIAVVTKEQLVEFSWGLADSGYPFLWVVRPDVLMGEAAVLSEEFVTETGERSMVVSWCPQEEVLLHPAIGGFLTHCGWNSTIESVSAGVPMICWAFFGDQQTNCRYVCDEWGIGVDVGSEVRREVVERGIREVMGGGEKGREMRRKAAEWRDRAVRASQPGGNSAVNLEMVVNEVLLAPKLSV